MAVAVKVDRVNARLTVVTYAALGANDAENGDHFELPETSAGLVIQVTGNFGGGADLTLEGSNDGTNFAAITRDIGDGMGLTAVSFSAAGIARVAGPFPRYLRCAVNDQGDANTALVVTIVISNLR